MQRRTTKHGANRERTAAGRTAVARVSLVPIRLAHTFAPLLVLVACGGHATKPDPATPAAGGDTASSAAVDPPAPSASAASASDAPAQLPKACSDAAAEWCTPPGDFVDRLCAKTHSDVGLALFAKSTPFTRAYMRGKIDELAFDEEVIVLRFHAVPQGGMVVGSGKGTYDLFRWDGTCSQGIEAEMITKTRPPKPKSAHVNWHRLGNRMQDSLIAASDAVKRAHAKRGKECQGAMTGDVSAGCAKADAALVDAVVDFVRGGGSLPDPEGLP
jgi:hypothetical protein